MISIMKAKRINKRKQIIRSVIDQFKNEKDPMVIRSIKAAKI